MTMMAIARLRTITQRCLTGQPIDPELAAWLGCALRRFLCHETCTIDDALGLRGAKGGVPWWLEEAMRTRNEALRRYAAVVAPNTAVTARARIVHRNLRRYAESAWRIDRSAESVPESYVGTPREHLWRAFKSGAPMPLGERQLRTILSD